MRSICSLAAFGGGGGLDLESAFRGCQCLHLPKEHQWETERYQYQYEALHSHVHHLAHLIINLH